MVELPQKKVGIVSCSGEELAEGTVTRLAALKVLEQLRPGDTVTICLPLFLAGGEGDRAFARFYPTIAVDGCDLRCAARGTEKYSGKPAASFVVSDLIQECGLDKPEGRRRLNQAGQQAVELLAGQMAEKVDELLDKRWNRRVGEFVPEISNDLALPVLSNASAASVPVEPVQATCSCGSGIPIQQVLIAGQEVTLVALPVLFEQFKEAGKAPNSATVAEMMEMLKIYNSIPAEAEPAYREAVLAEYTAYCQKEATR
jgi:uncharacterized metal-binding protein